jgi:hypothetical protein
MMRIKVVLVPIYQVLSERIACPPKTLWTRLSHKIKNIFSCAIPLWILNRDIYNYHHNYRSLGTVRLLRRRGAGGF